MNIFKIFLLAVALFPAVASGQNSSQKVELWPAPGTVNVNPDARLRLTFKETPTLGTKGMIRVFDAATGLAVDSLDLSIPAGPTESREYGPECDYTKKPYNYLRAAMPTNRNTRPGTPSGTAEPNPPCYQLNIIGGFTDAFHFHPVIVRGNTATVYLHNNILEYGHTYYITVDNGAIIAKDGGFNGISKAEGWSFSTKKNAPQADSDTLVVDAKGEGDFYTVQGALDFLPDFGAKHTLILVRPGDYEEIVYARNKQNVTIKGGGMNNTRVHYANNEVFNPHPLTVKTNEWPGSFPSRRAAFMLDNCRNITLEDITVATDLTGQAEGLLLNGQRIALYRVHIIGSGDALQANGTIYMEQCELDGGGDTILGRGSLFALRSNFRNDGGPFTWVRNTKGNHGDVFVECTFSTTEGRTADFGRTKTNHGTAYPDAELVLIDCKTRNIIPEGWSVIGEKSVTLLEFNTRDMDTNKPVDTSKRHPYSRQLDKKKDATTISNYRNPAFVLKGWTPKLNTNKNKR